MREISPAHNATTDEFMAQAPDNFKRIVELIRHQKITKTRQLPSPSLIDKSNILTHEFRKQLIDKVADLVDENLAGRSEMCQQFSQLLAMALNKLGFPAKAVIGDSVYFINQKKVFSWKHSWVRIGNEVIDANVDILHENPFIPKSVKIKPYWGSVSEVPSDRRLHQDHSSKLAEDSDVNSIWWPDLEEWLVVHLN
jgi:hypothetical protein